ncbi:MAG: transglycosylase SLT domain-containing protein [Acidothermaceae bacterium]
MSVVDDVQSRIAAINQIFPTLSVSGVQASGSIVASTQTYGSEFESALASVSSNDIASSAGENGAMSSSGGATLGGVSGSQVVADAEQYLGVPYQYGGTDPSKGLDCSALVQRAYADLGISLPRTSQEQATVGTPVASLAQAQPGDLVCFGSPATHIGIYVGDGKMVVAPHTGTNVQVQEITTTPSTIRRIVADPGSSAFAAASSRPAALTTAPNGGWPAGAGAYSAAFTAAEKKYNLPTGMLSAVAHAESGYRPDAVSSAGAVGLMQLMPDTANALGVDATNPAQAIEGAAQLLRGQLTKYGSVPLALAAYNAGGPAVDKYGGIPPYPETQNYVQKVMTYMNEDA